MVRLACNGMNTFLNRLGGCGDASIAVGILDGRVDLTHSCFAGAHLSEIGATSAPIDPTSAAVVHGTQIASILFGRQGSSVPGIVPQCRGISVPIFVSHDDQIGCSQVDLARAILLAVENGAHVIRWFDLRIAAMEVPSPHFVERRTADPTVSAR